MKKKVTKFMSILLVFLLVFSILPGQLIASAAEAAYEVLTEPIDNLEGVSENTFGDVAVVWEKIYYDPISGKVVGENYPGARHPYYLAQYTSSGVKRISDWYTYIDYGLSESGYAVIESSEYKYGIINAEGEVVFSPEFSYIREITQDGYTIATTEDGIQVLLDLNRRTRASLSHINANSLGAYNNGILLIRNVDDNYDAHYQYVTLDGTFVFSGGYRDAESFYNGHAHVTDTSGESWEGQIIDTSGKIVLSDQDKGFSFSYHSQVSTEGLICVQDNNYRYGYIGLDSNFVIPPQYANANVFRNGFAKVRNSNWNVGMIDTSGDEVIPFGQYYDLSNASRTGLVWATDKNGNVSVVRVGSSSESEPSVPSKSSEYIYDTVDPGEDTKLDADRLNRVTDPASAAEAVRDMVNGMTQAQKDSPTGVDLATLYAETSVAKAASKSFTGNDVLISAATVADLEVEATQAVTAVETVLIDGGIATARYLSSTVTLTTSSTSEISIRIDPDILTTSVDKVRVEGPSYALTFNISELEEDLTNILIFRTEPVNASGVALASGKNVAPLAATLLVNRTADMEPVYIANTGTNAVNVTLPGGSTSNPVTVSLPKDNSKDTTYQAVVNTTGTATSSKYNPATTAVDGKINTSGTYTVTTKEVNFTDIANKSTEMQKAIKYLASKGIISGTGGTNYSPDASISRAEIAALLVRAMGKLNSSAANSFTDVKSSDWYYTAAGSSQKAGYISGYEDKTFRGSNTINKEQIVAVAARVLINDMKYKIPSNTATYLGKYSDTVASWAQPQVALATKENLVVYRTDGTFSGTKNMTRGDAAIIIYRLFQKIW